MVALVESIKGQINMVASSLISFSCAPSLFTSLFSTTYSSPKLTSLSISRNPKLLRIRLARLGHSNGSRTICWFKFGKNGVDVENAVIYGSQSRDDLLMLAATEGDRLKIKELLRVCANYSVKDADGRTALDRTNSDLILGYTAQKA